ncbi:hypothetical protein L249_7064 [Ophiocordyceps polyrhachis-furcata BCC 54312]|uniref:Uncharacterized protein n=1 Tax=Ophiocordyceps polyrhachis-furcata BCC 54312 TaxID=1330021 RepID=A0A367LL60_9HYPO|nr:hypothetical protein L249_7064 [Ophiocordyceps polyrhachis-furcata BCC 54312]
MDDLAAFILGPLMRNYIHPVFPQLTGTASIPGREESISIVTSTLHWVIQQTNSNLFADHWPVLLPILLDLIDGPEPRFRIKGLQILHDFLCKCPRQILTTTGIGRVFEDAVYPSVYFLPGSMNEKESAILLSEAYRVLLQLAEAGQADDQKRRSLDRIIRDGVLTGYRHAPDSPVVVDILMRNLAVTVFGLGTHAVKHLQNILCVVESATMESSAVSHPSTVVAALEALNAILVCCWPRFTEASYADQVTRIVIVCWLALGDQAELDKSATRDQNSGVHERLVTTMGLIKNIARGHSLETRDQVMSDMLSREPRLASLLHNVGY